MSVVVLVGRTREQRRRALGPVAGLDAWQRPDFLYLTATRRKAEVVRAAFWDQPDKPETFLPDVRPWGDFRDDLASRWGDGRALMGPVPRELLAGALFRTLQPRLRAWRGLRDGAETRRALAELAESWGLGFSGPRPPDLGDEPFSLRFPGEPDHTWGPLFASTAAVGADVRHDAWRFLGAWRAALQRSGAWTDRPELTRSLLAALAEPPAELLASLGRWKGVIVDDLLWLPPLDRAVLRTFIARFRDARPEGTVYLCLEAAVGGAVERARSWIEGGALPGEGGDEITEDLRGDWRAWLAPSDGDRPAGRLKVADAEPSREDLSDLVARDAVIEDAAEAVAGVRVRSYSSLQAEVGAIARALKAELLTGRRPDELFVSFPELDRYAPLVRDVLTSYGIPFVVEKGEELLHSPPCSGARQLLRLATTEADPASLRSLLASGWVRAWFPVDEAMAEPLLRGLPPLLGARFEPLAQQVRERITELVALAPDMAWLQAGITSSGATGRPREWLPSLVAWRVRKAEDQLARSGRDATRAEGIERRLLRDLARTVVDVLAVERLLDALTPVREAANAREAASRFAELLSSLGIRPQEPDPGLDRVRADAMRANGAAIEALLELVADVATSLEGVENAAPGGLSTDGAAALLRDALEEGVRRASFRASGPRLGVQIVGVRDLHGADVPWLWVGGLADGAFPRGPLPGFLLPHTEPPLVPRIDRAAEDRAIFASLLRSAGHGERRHTATLILSWPRTEAGKDLVPSPLLADLTALRLREGAKGDGEGAKGDGEGAPGDGEGAQGDGEGAPGDGEGALGDWWAAAQRREEAALPPLLSRDELLTRPELCAQLPPLSPLHHSDPLADPQPEPADPPLLSLADRTIMAAWDELVAARSAEDGFGAWDGVLGMDRPWRPLALAWLGDLLGMTTTPRGRRQLSLRTTGLEQWAKCPIRFLFQSVLGVEEPKPYAMEPGRDESGTLVHEVLERFLGELIAAKASGKASSSALWTMGTAERERASARLREIALQTAEERLGHRRGPWVERLVEDLVAGLGGAEGDWQGPLARFLEEEWRGHFLDAEPAKVEFSFDGLSPAQSAWRLSPDKDRDPVFRVGTGDVDVRLRGSIDRVDLPPRRGGGGRPRGDGGLRVVVYDYKTGATPYLDAVDEGLQLQPAVYPMAVDVPWWASGIVSGYWELREEPGRQRRRLAISTRLRRYLLDQPGLRRPVGMKWTSASVTMWAWRAWLMRADWYGQLVAAGVFPTTLHTAKVAGCQYCPVRRACRTEPVRTERVLNPHPGPSGRPGPVFWPTRFSVADGLDAMFGPRGGEPDPEPITDEDEQTHRSTPVTSLPAPGPPVTNEFDDLFDGDDF